MIVITRPGQFFVLRFKVYFCLFDIFTWCLKVISNSAYLRPWPLSSPPKSVPAHSYPLSNIQPVGQAGNLVVIFVLFCFSCDQTILFFPICLFLKKIIIASFWPSHTYSFSHITFHHGLSEEIGYSSLFCTVGHSLLIHSKYKSWGSPTPNPRSFHSPGTHTSALHIHESVSVL